MPRSKSQKRKGQLTYTKLKTLKAFNQIDYEQRFFWDKLILMDTIDLNDKILREKTESFIKLLKSDEFFKTHMTENQITALEIKFQEKKFNNIYQIFDDILELIFKMPKIKNHTIFDFLPMNAFLAEESFRIFKEKIIEVFYDICTETIEKNKPNDDYDGNEFFVYMEIEAFLYSVTISKEKKLKIFNFIKERFGDRVEQKKKGVYCFDPRSLSLEEACELLEFIKGV